MIHAPASACFTLTTLQSRTSSNKTVPLCRAEHARDRTTTHSFSQTDAVSRRAALCIPAVSVSLLPLLAAGAPPAKANIVQDLAKAFVRPELASDEALLIMMDARGTLFELRDLAATPSNSQERFETRRLLPGMAKKLREVGVAAPIVAALVKGTGKEQVVSELYGGDGGEVAATDEVYTAIGNIVTISGRTIRKEAQASPDRADAAIQKIQELLDRVPEEAINRCEEFRSQRRSAARTA